ncbi:MAG: GDP-mannose 4,6-dehydratase [Candidatus Omnitrophica bacterium]|nr:GDP-mannose 4,6-dehydratase [Candidatus Omnitrophota bacterium]
MQKNLDNKFKNKNILITGGLGFIGSNLAIKLVNLGAKVTLMDAMLADYGANRFNIEPVKDKVKVDESDIRDADSVNRLVQGKDFIFHLAGQVSHVLSLSNPFLDIDINIKGTAMLMEACRNYNRSAKVIYTGTRGQYGSVVKLPVDETTPTNPKGIYEISNLTAEKIIKVYNDNFGIKCVLLRLTNVYGPRSQMKNDHYGVVNWFMRLALEDKEIKVFGDGKLKRDFLYVDDCVDALIMSAANENAYGEIFNVGINKPTTFVELAELIVQIAGSGRWEFAPFSAERKALEPGDYYSDISKIKEHVTWEPRISLAEGIKASIGYYQKYRTHYWE